MCKLHTERLLALSMLFIFHWQNVPLHSAVFYYFSALFFVHQLGLVTFLKRSMLTLTTLLCLHLLSLKADIRAVWIQSAHTVGTMSNCLKTLANHFPWFEEYKFKRLYFWTLITYVFRHFFTVLIPELSNENAALGRRSNTNASVAARCYTTSPLNLSGVLSLSVNLTSPLPQTLTFFYHFTFSCTVRAIKICLCWMFPQCSSFLYIAYKLSNSFQHCSICSHVTTKHLFFSAFTSISRW